MHADQAFTREAAIKSVIRLYESIDTEKKEQTSELSSVKTMMYDKSIITNKLLAKANALPKVTSENIPYWTGFVYGFGYKDDLTVRFKQSDIRNMANWGFNSVRVYIDYRSIFSEDVSKVNLYALKKLDIRSLILFSRQMPGTALF